MNIYPLLQAKLDPLARRQSRIRLALALAAVWFISAVWSAALINLHHSFAWPAPLVLGLSLALPLVSTAWLLIRFRKHRTDYCAVALNIEATYPELDGRLLTAVQQQPDGEGNLNLLQERIIQEVLQHEAPVGWTRVIPSWRTTLSYGSSVITLALLASVLSQFRFTRTHGIGFFAASSGGVTVTPGDVSLERGSSLVVMGRFDKVLPPKVDLVIVPPLEGRQRIPLVKSLADPMFGVTIPELNSNLVYHLEFGSSRTRDFKATVFDFPRLERADADVEFPTYTGMGPKHFPNTRRLTSVEGSRAVLRLLLNKPVASATLVAKDTNQARLQLAVETNQPAASLMGYVFEASRTYDLQLVDLDGRTNKVPARFVFEVLKNRTPELKIAAPGGDTRPSPLEEVSFDGTVWDDFGVQAYGLAFAVAGKAPKSFQLGTNVPAKQKQPFNFLLRGEEFGLQPDDLVSWYVWAEDIGPDGKTRRTTGDLYFAEVRPFEEIFREGQSGAGGEQQGGGGGGQAGQAAETQKQIISATWNLFRRQNSSLQQNPSSSRETNAPGKSERSSSLHRRDRTGLASLPSARAGYLFAQRRDQSGGAGVPGRSRSRPDAPSPPLKDDLNVIIEAQEQVFERAKAAKERQQNPNSATLWDAAVAQLERALERLRAAASSPSELEQALAAEQAAFQALLKLQEREYSVTRNRNRQSGQGGNQQQMRRQLDQLDLSQAEDRYETERQAQAPQSAERSEQLQVMNRLQELARRQQDVNQQLKDLQTALQEARTEQEREDIQRRLKRLQEEEQKLLADADELRQRMDRPENQSRMSEQRRQLEQAREDLQRAADAAQQGQTSQALASGTRAQQQLQNAREDLRRQSAGEFDQELRDLRGEARELARQQEEIQKQMESTTDPRRRTLSSGETNQQSLEQLTQQRDRLTNLVTRATDLSQQAEQAEPLMSRELYDTLRKFSQDDLSTLKQFQEDLMNRGQISRELYQRLKETEQSGSKSLDLTAEFLRQGLAAEAATAQERARAGIDDLKRGVERAAGSVLGDEAQSLRRARDELERLAEQLSREISQSAPGQNQTNAGAGSSGAQIAENRSQATPADGAETSPTGEPGGQAQSQSANSARSGSNEVAAAESAQRQPRNGAPNPNPSGQPGDANQQSQAGSPGNQDSSASGGQGQREGALTGTNPERNSRAQGGQRRGASPLDVDRFLEGRGGSAGGPITGADFGAWSDGLREVEELIDTPNLRSDVARARERARQMRQDFKRGQKKPDWAEVRLQILKPLVEAREQVAEELARLGPREDLVPVDRDPVPGRYSDLVRRYYEALGNDNRQRAETPAPAPR